jgi:AraC family transcriptional regulator of adaptative response/methylated-DNA-[protein]-cysteine methyltransferase
MVEQVCEYLEERVNQPDDYEPPTLEELGDRFDYSPSHLQRVFKQLTGVTPFEYAETRRWERLQDSLSNSADVTTAIYDAGFSSPSRVYERAYDQLGMTPWAYLKRGTGEHLRYTIAETTIGWILVATTDKGICSVQFGDNPVELAEELANTFIASSIELSPDLDQTVHAILDHLNGKQPNTDLPLDIQSTAFQRAVWNELQKIPVGETRTYGEVATAIGDPNAARAVGNACSKNPTALLIPCHRVVPASGETGAYRWGADRKAWLLEQESRLS